MILCEICFQPANIIATNDDPYGMAHFFCQEHYDNWQRNEIELPRSRLNTLQSYYD